MTQIGNTFYINRTRYDTTDTLHETLEMVVESELVTIISSAASQWIPNSTTNPEYLEDGTTLLNTQFPVVNAGVNLNNSTGYLFSGTATSAQYADLAERYAADSPIEYGSVVILGGTKEITKSTSDKSPDVFGVISTNPAFMMNSGAGNNTSHPYVALAGRVPCRVIGKVKKGDRLVSSTFPGHARAVVTGEEYSSEHIIGRALEANIVLDTGLIEIVIGAR